jgi:hypothetical protein
MGSRSKHTTHAQWIADLLYAVPGVTRVEFAYDGDGRVRVARAILTVPRLWQRLWAAGRARRVLAGLHLRGCPFRVEIYSW